MEEWHRNTRNASVPWPGWASADSSRKARGYRSGREGKKLFTASSSSVNMSKTTANRVSTSSSMILGGTFRSLSVPPALCSAVKVETMAPSQTESMYVVPPRFRMMRFCPAFSLSFTSLLIANAVSARWPETSMITTPSRSRVPMFTIQCYTTSPSADGRCLAASKQSARHGLENPADGKRRVFRRRRFPRARG